MKTITAAEANRGFSHLLRDVSNGQEYTILSRGKPVAKITSLSSENTRRAEMKKNLLSRLRSQESTGTRSWTRDELYDR
ncbi:MAG: type II toxin-antitoxin system prevent-host-death family antitoxin [Desulfovermiculus sp.]|nr:type II toxin-antitoxin system prevent-host-death family antitoxin [Desulfovermiculus sp.]